MKNKAFNRSNKQKTIRKINVLRIVAKLGIERPVSMGLLKYIKNFQIVNGGQITASIFKAKEAEDKLSLNGAFVQVKLIVLSECCTL